MPKLLCLILGFLITASAAAGEFSLKSSAFRNNERIPIQYTCNGDNLSPPLRWDNAPLETKSFVLTLTAPGWINEDVYLWILYNLPLEIKSLEQGIQYLPQGTKVGTNFYDEANYRGPCPPDERVHAYVFTLYALDTLLYPVDDELDPEKLFLIIKPHILKKTTLTGLFSH